MDKIIAIKALLQTPEYAGLTAEEQLAKINTGGVSYTQEIGSRALLKWAGASGRAARIKRTAENDALPEELQSAAFAAYKMMDRADTTLDISDPEVVGLVDGLVGAGVLSADDKSALFALADKTGTDAERLGIVPEGGEVYLGHINQARSLIE